jgi:APA family basic amino acid/polyamine antiporter
VHPKHRTPYISTILTGVFVAVGAQFMNIDDATDLCNIGTLFAFVLVSLGVMVLRRIDPARPRPFRTPWVPIVPVLAIISCGFLMCEQPKSAWRRFVIWLVVGLVIYFSYGSRRSELAAPDSSRTAPDKNR